MTTRRKKRTWLIVLILIAIGVYLWWEWDDDEPEALRGDPSLVFNRLWVDSVQKDERDFVHALIVVTKLPVGVFQKASQYRIEAERFDYRHKRGPARLALHFPQSGKEAVVRYSVRACDDLPPYDLCLELQDNPWGGPRRYYGVREAKRAGERHRQLRRSILSHL